MTATKLWGGLGLLIKLFIPWVSTVLTVQYQIMSVAASPEEGTRFHNEVYSQVLISCEDKLKAWRDVSPSVSMANTSTSSRPQFYSSSGIFMRGKWWRPRGGDDQVFSPFSSSSEFFQGSEGKFDFFSSGVNMSLGEIQNITVSMFILNAKGSPRGPVLDASGLLNVETGEVCLVGCSRTTLATELKPTSRITSTNISTMVPSDGSVEHEGQEAEHDCSIRGFMDFTPGEDHHHLQMDGRLESMRNSSDPEWFTPIRLSGKLVNDIDQRALYHREVFVTSGLYFTEAGIIVWQIAYSMGSSSGYFVSVLAILVQIVVLSFTAARFLYIPLRLLSYREFKSLFTSLALIPSFLILLLILLNCLFLSLILRKRRMAKRSNIPDRPHELRLASACLILYVIIGVILWSLENFTTYLQVVWCWFLLPQLVANVFWDLRTNPLHPVYSVGLSLCRIIFIGYDSLRPTIYGYDDLNDFPQSWFWGITLTIMFLLGYSLLQQRYGSRCFLPQRWFGYEQLPHSNSQSTQHESSPKAEDQMLNL